MSKNLPRRHFFDGCGVQNCGIAYTNNNNFWRVVDGKVAGYTDDLEIVKQWKRELCEKSKAAVAKATGEAA